MRLDLHTHSKHSADSYTEPSEIVRLARERGMDGIAVTDHRSSEGGFEAREWAKKNMPDFLVITGVEHATDVGHVVGLFIETEPRVDKAISPVREVVSAIHEAGGIAVLAHPFERHLKLPPDLFEKTGLDALEGFNGRADSLRNPRANAMAQQYAQEHGIPMTGGSDAHFEWEVARAGCVVEDLEPGASLDRVRNAIMAGQAAPFGSIVPRTTSPRTSLVNIRKRGTYRNLPKVLLRLLLASLGKPGLWLENLLSHPLEELGETPR